VVVLREWRKLETKDLVLSGFYMGSHIEYKGGDGLSHDCWCDGDGLGVAVAGDYCGGCGPERGCGTFFLLLLSIKWGKLGENWTMNNDVRNDLKGSGFIFSSSSRRLFTIIDEFNFSCT
jgi:hypothetical protein